MCASGVQPPHTLRFKCTLGHGKMERINNQLRVVGQAVTHTRTRCTPHLQCSTHDNKHRSLSPPPPSHKRTRHPANPFHMGHMHVCMRTHTCQSDHLTHTGGGGVHATRLQRCSTHRPTPPTHMRPGTHIWHVAGGHQLPPSITLTLPRTHPPNPLQSLPLPASRSLPRLCTPHTHSTAASHSTYVWRSLS